MCRPAPPSPAGYATLSEAHAAACAQKLLEETVEPAFNTNRGERIAAPIGSSLISVVGNVTATAKWPSIGCPPIIWIPQGNHVGHQLVDFGAAEVEIHLSRIVMRAT